MKLAFHEYQAPLLHEQSVQRFEEMGVRSTTLEMTAIQCQEMADLLHEQLKLATNERKAVDKISMFDGKSEVMAEIWEIMHEMMEILILGMVAIQTE